MLFVLLPPTFLIWIISPQLKKMKRKKTKQRKYSKLQKKPLSKLRFLALFLLFFLTIGYLYYIESKERDSIKILRIYSHDSILAETPTGTQKIGLLGVKNLSQSELDMYSRLSGFPVKSAKSMRSHEKMLSEARSLIKKKIKTGNILYVENLSVTHPLTKQKLYLIPACKW